MNYSTMTQRETEIELGTSAAEGITSFAAHDRLIEYGRNTPEKTYSVGNTNLILAQAKNIYTAAYFLMGLAALIINPAQNMPVWIIFFLTAASNVALGIRRDLVSRRAAAHFDLMRSDKVNIVRDGKDMQTDPTLLVKGDIIILKKGDVVPADARILECSGLKVDESFFRRNSVPIVKSSDKLDFEGDMTKCSNMLYCGSSVVDGTARAAVVETGAGTELAKMTESRSKKLNLYESFSKNKPAERILALAATITAGIIMLAVSIKTRNASEGLMAAFTGAVALLPVFLRTVRTAAVKRTALKLRKKQVSIAKNDFVYDLGGIDCVLIDKGKMLTDSSLKLEEHFGGRDALIMAALCGECEIGEYGSSAGDIDSAAVNAAVNAGIDMKALSEEHERLITMPFDDRENLMAVVCRRGDGFCLIVKGAIESVPSRCTAFEKDGESVPLGGSALNDAALKSAAMAENGLKVRIVAYRMLDSLPEAIEGEIHDLTLSGIFGYREIMTPKASESVDKLRENYVETYVVTGDHMLTAAALAKEAGVIKSEKECVDCRNLDALSDDELYESAETVKVFANASMPDRVRLVRTLSARSKVTAVAGDNMAAPETAMCAAASFGKEDEGDYDVSLRRLTFENVASVITECRTMRSNMSVASSMRSAIGIAEAMTLIFAALTEAVFPLSLLEIVILNLFIAFIPCFTVALFANTSSAERGRNAAVTSAVRGFTAAAAAVITATCAGFGAAVIFFALHAVFEAAGVHFTVMKKFDVSDALYALWSLVIFAAVSTFGANLLNLSAAELFAATVAALIATGINIAVEIIRRRRASA